MTCLWLTTADAIDFDCEALTTRGVTVERLDPQVFAMPPTAMALLLHAPLDPSMVALAETCNADLLPVSCPIDLRLAVFDMDSTLIQHEVIDELATALGIGAEVAAITERAMQGELDFVSSFTARLGLLQGLPESRLQPIYDGLRLMPGAECLMANLGAAGVFRAICSGGFSFFAEQLTQRLGVDQVHSNRLQCADGVLTGVVVPPIVDGAYKARFLAELAAEHNVLASQVMAVGDGANDIPMLEAAGVGVAFHGKPKVREAIGLQLNHRDLSALSYWVHPRLGLRDGGAHPV